MRAGLVEPVTVSSSNSSAHASRPRALAARLEWLRDRAALVRRGLRGVEKESLRVTADGRLSQRPHPRSLGAALTHPFITTDYSEALPELVTPPLRTSWETVQFLCDVHAFIHRRLDGELLWPASMPCSLGGNDDIPIADYGPSNLGRMKTVYRRGLGHRYGRAMQAIAGVHFNYSLPAEFWPEYREHEGRRESPADFRSAELMGLVRNYRRCAWLVTYLFGASPALSKSFRPEGHELLTELDRDTWHAPFATSLRMSDLGYRNKSQGRLSIRANSLSEYVAGMRAAVTTEDPRYAAIGVVVDGDYRQLNANILQIENEYYSTIRPKPSKASSYRPLIALERTGVEYVEVRTLDLNCADPIGMNQNELRLLEALLIRCLLAESPPISASEQAEIDSRDLTVAREGRRPGLALVEGGRARPLAACGTELLEQVRAVAELLDADGTGYVAAVDAAADALREPGRTPSAAVLAALQGEGASFFEYTLALARSHAAYFRELALAPEREESLAATVRRSLEEAEALAHKDTRSFEAYLAEHFAAI
ncbi:MAG TPA: glutamate--cysteine ligase [Gammaproteobacteria bacterium]|jgi:glutamate--cysteine ligase|nr:glutamate--cysteine ligase [Gammaproteobacteria bacterium]